jgi:hypothetical protein
MHEGRDQRARLHYSIIGVVMIAAVGRVLNMFDQMHEGRDHQQARLHYLIISVVMIAAVGLFIWSLKDEPTTWTNCSTDGSWLCPAH